jgi:hypothetical protein
MNTLKKTKYKYIHFEPIRKDEGPGWYCFSNLGKNCLGLVEWYARWKQWQYVPAPKTAYTSECHRDIADFMDQLEKPLKEQP